jgi:neutral ceramidase
MINKIGSFLCLLIFCFNASIVFSQTQIRAGVAKVNITPSLGTVINGDFLPFYAKGIHDSLYAKALAFDNGKKRFVFVVVDCMAIDGVLINDTKKIITLSTGLKSEQVMISATHAHSCGAVRGGSVCPADLPYRLAMPERINKAVKLALANLQPAKIAWGKIDVPQHVSCRRWYMKPGFKTVSPFGDTDKVWMNPPRGSEFLDRPAGPTDPQVGYLAIKSMDDKWISILANYSIHYAADVPEHTISADYFGEVHKQLKLKLGAGDDFIGIMSNGTSGDINTFDFKLERNYPKEPYGKSKLIANDVSDAIISSLQNAKFENKPEFNFKYKELIASTRQPTPELVQKSKERVKNLDFNTLNSIDKASVAITNLYALEIIELNEYQKTK